MLVLGKPLGVGVMSAALKKGVLDDAGYAELIANTTRLNKPGAPLADLPGVHAITDITGFGLAGHTLELARGAGVTIEIDWNKVPLLPGVEAMAAEGLVTGASGRNWAGYGAGSRAGRRPARHRARPAHRPADLGRPARQLRPGRGRGRAAHLPRGRLRRCGGGRSGRRGQGGAARPGVAGAPAYPGPAAARSAASPSSRASSPAGTSRQPPAFCPDHSGE